MNNNLTSQTKKDHGCYWWGDLINVDQRWTDAKLITLPVLYMSPYIVILFSSLYENVYEGCSSLNTILLLQLITK